VAQGAAPKVRKVYVQPDAVLQEDYTLSPADAGTLAGTVSITGGNWEQHASLSVRQDYGLESGRTEEEIEVDFVSVAHEGQYALELPAGTYAVTASTYGWSTQEQTVTVTTGQTTALDISF